MASLASPFGVAAGGIDVTAAEVGFAELPFPCALRAVFGAFMLLLTMVSFLGSFLFVIGVWRMVPPVRCL